MIKSLRMFYKISFVLAMLFIFVLADKNNVVEAQDIPELHMIVFQGDVIIGTGNVKTSSLDGYVLDAKIDNKIVASTEIGKNLTGRYSGLEVGPIVELEGKKVKNIDDFNEILAIKNYRSGDKLKLKIWRRGRYLDRTLILG